MGLLRWARGNTKDHVKNEDIWRDANLPQTKTTAKVWPHVKAGENITKKMLIMQVQRKRREGEAQEKMAI